MYFCIRIPTGARSPEECNEKSARKGIKVQGHGYRLTMSDVYMYLFERKAAGTRRVRIHVEAHGDELGIEWGRVLER